MKKLINKLFLVREIRSKDGVLHFRRWRIISTKWFNIFIHGIYKADDDVHLHDHPWDYMSIILKGSFIEATRNGSPDWHTPYNYTTIKAPRVVIREAGEFHKITHLSKPVFTLFITGNRFKEWGYYVEGLFVNNEKYRQLKREGKV